MNRLIYIVPVLAFGGLAYLLFHSLSAPPPDELPSTLIGKPAPPLSLPPLDAKAKGFSRDDLAAGHVTVLNVWASWCVPCREEAPALVQLAQEKGVQLDGLVYKDKAAKARAFLDEAGDPFARIDADANGRAAIDWGVYDVPETFVIDGHGIVRLRYSGPITPDVLSSTILPAIESARTRS
ncbi:MAG TPA: DsbE family thiol:disulfide interchange protein [Rhizomicrobium sp.]|jgi:cytochrome c biogenesis protein CcmG/thiol:disulfide interchange protein DsbE